jgi:hypothetical protein
VGAEQSVRARRFAIAEIPADFGWAHVLQVPSIGRARLLDEDGQSCASNTPFMLFRYSLKAVRPLFVSLSAVWGFRSMNSLTIST